MIFVAMVLIVAIACSAITVKTLVGYSQMAFFFKVLVSLFVLVSWMSPAIIMYMKRRFVTAPLMVDVMQVMYFFFGFAFILFVFLMTRDVIWYLGYFFKKLPSPKDLYLLNVSNICAVVLSLVVALYSLYEGIRTPRIKEVDLYSSKVEKPFNIVLLTDIHITRATSVKSLNKLIAKVNNLKPDVILLVGDIIDDQLSFIDEKANLLKNLKAKDGVYLSLGNHEIYNGRLEVWENKFRNMGSHLKLLTNEGVDLPDENVYILGIPDKRISMFSSRYETDYDGLMKDVPASRYKLLMSHAPNIEETRPENLFDLQVSGHTHGGQIFPFHILAKLDNKLLAGLYQEGETKIYVSRGAGFWGPPVRFLAPSEITLIKILPEVKK